jgi:hypothetical protein
MTNSIDTITLPEFTTDTLSSYLNNMSVTGSYGISSSMSAGDTITISNNTNGPYAGSTFSGSYTGSMFYNTTNNSNYVYTGTGGGWSSVSPSYGTDFVDKFPEWIAFRKLCEEYPGLDKAYENLKLVYSVCYADSLLPKEPE